MNKKRLSISLVIPAYNEDNHIRECLESVAAQTTRPQEVIVVDNNSTDATRSLAKQYPFVKIISEKKQGIIFARNRGFNEAKGDIIGRIDADAVLPTNWVECVSEYFSNSHNLNSAWTSGARFHNVSFSRSVSSIYNFLVFEGNRVLIGHPTLWGSSMAILNEHWQEVKLKNTGSSKIHEDLDLSMFLHEAGVGIYYDRIIKVNARLRSSNASRKELWDYLQWWPNTLRAHHKKSWPIVWFFGTFGMYCLTPLLNISDKLSGKAKG